MLKAATVMPNVSATLTGASTGRTVSPCAEKTAAKRSACSGFVGMPVEGPPRWTSTHTSGSSATLASPSTSVLSERPGPEVAVMALTPANDAPTAAATPAISSSACSSDPPCFQISRPRYCMISDAGCKFFGGYPITPASEIMQYLGREIWKHGGSLLQAEDEIAGVAAAVGASFAGVKAMTATSGPGLSLKTEVLGLASVAELPLVCVDVQRGGPSTGMPTKPEQADLFAAVFSAHGDTVRPVLAPVSVADTFGITVEAFNIAEQYQTPVLVLSDQEIAQRKEIVDPVDPSRYKLVDRLQPTGPELEKYVRFRFTESGISPLSHPGMKGGNYLAAGIEHNELGAPTANGELHARMNDKRLKKMDPLKRRRDLFLIEGDPDATIGLISWGSIAGVAMAALQLARAEGIKARLLVPKLLYPVAENIYQEFFAPLQQCLVVEQSHQGQLYRIIRMWVSVPPRYDVLAKSGSNPIAPEEILEKLRAMARG